MSVEDRRNIRRAIYGKLNVSALTNQLGTPAHGAAIYYETAPETAVFPLVLFNKQSGVPTDALGFRRLTPAPVDVRLEDTDIWLIKGVTRDSSADVAESIAGQIQLLLNDKPLSPAGGLEVVYLRRQSDVDYGEVIEGVQYKHSGSLYRLVWQ
jgi:hypothetical protein